MARMVMPLRFRRHHSAPAPRSVRTLETSPEATDVESKAGVGAAVNVLFDVVDKLIGRLARQHHHEPGTRAELPTAQKAARSKLRGRLCRHARGGRPAGHNRVDARHLEIDRLPTPSAAPFSAIPAVRLPVNALAPTRGSDTSRNPEG